MQEAALMNFLRTILVIVVVYYLLKIVGRLLFPLFFKKMMSNVEKKFNQQGYPNKQEESPLKEGETVIDKAPKNKPTTDKTGEYVDYEELE